MPRVQPLDRDEISDPGVLAVLEAADRNGVPPASWHLVMAHHPELTKRRAEFWDYLYRGGLVDQRLKESVRLFVAELQECGFCSAVRPNSPDGEVSGDEACAIVVRHTDDPREAAALRFARVLHSGSREMYDDAYADMHSHFSPAEIMELGCLISWVLGGTAFVRSLSLTPVTANTGS